MVNLHHLLRRRAEVPAEPDHEVHERRLEVPAHVLDPPARRRHHPVHEHDPASSEPIHGRLHVSLHEPLERPVPRLVVSCGRRAVIDPLTGGLEPRWTPRGGVRLVGPVFRKLRPRPGDVHSNAQVRILHDWQVLVEPADVLEVFGAAEHGLVPEQALQTADKRFGSEKRHRVKSLGHVVRRQEPVRLVLLRDCDQRHEPTEHGSRRLSTRTQLPPRHVHRIRRHLGIGVEKQEQVPGGSQGASVHLPRPAPAPGPVTPHDDRPE